MKTGGYITQRNKIPTDQETIEKVKALLGTQDYKNFVKKLGKLSNDKKVMTLLGSGLFDGSRKDESFKMEIKEIPVKNLKPTQSEIDMDKSLSVPLKAVFPNSLEEVIVGKNVEIVAPVVVLNDKYILDGHHRWSQVYSMNKDATVKALVFTGNIKPLDMLKVLQVAIANEIQEVPTKNVRGTNLLKVKDAQVIKEVLEKITPKTLNIMKKHGKIQNGTKEEAVKYVLDNIHAMQRTSQPIPNAPSRNFMPQTDEARYSLEQTRKGKVNFRAPLMRMKSGGSVPKADRPFKVRFHLGRGKDYMKWRLEDSKERKVEFLDPDSVQLVMTNCVLTNRSNRAKKIFSGEINKEPIAFIQCAHVEKRKKFEKIIPVGKLSYNPRKAPHWQDINGNDIDGHYFDKIITSGRSVYAEKDGEMYELGGLVELNSLETLSRIDKPAYNFKTGGSLRSQAEQKFIYVMREFGKGRLKHGTTGKKVTDRDMALAIAYSEARNIDSTFGNDHKKSNGGQIGGTLFTWDNDYGGTITVFVKDLGKGKHYVRLVEKRFSEKYGKPVFYDRKELRIDDKDLKELHKKLKEKNPKITRF